MELDASGLATGKHGEDEVSYGGFSPVAVDATFPQFIASCVALLVFLMRHGAWHLGNAR